MKKKKKIKEPHVSQTVYYLRVDYDNDYSEMRSDEQDELYRWSKTNDITLNSLELVTKNDKFWDIVIDFEVGVGDYLYVVWVIYSAGDSYGSETGKVEYIGAYYNLADAIAVTEALKQKDENVTKIDITLPSGKRETILCGAFVGYFETVSSINYKQLRVE